MKDAAKKRLALVAPNLTPNVPPFLRKLAMRPEVDLTVYLCSDYGIVPTKNKMFAGKEIYWGKELLEGYHSKILKNWGKGPNEAGFFGLVNPSVFFEIIKNKYDAVLIYGYMRLSSWLAYLACLLSRTPMLFQGESSLKQNVHRSGVKIKIKEFILRSFFKRISAFLYLGEENKRYYLHYGVPEEKLFFTPYAADNEKLFSIYGELRPKRDEMRRKLGVGPDDVAVVFCGKLYDVKRPMDLLRAYERALKEIPAGEKRKLFLLFAGDGVMRPEVERYIAEHGFSGAKCLGYFEYHKTPELYTIGDIFTLVSNSETWGMVVNEALCFHLPAILSDAVGSGTDLVKYGENGFIFPVGDVSALSEAILELFRDAAMRKRFGEKSFEIIKKYSYDADVEGIVGACGSISK